MALTDTARGGSVAPPDDDAGDVGPDGGAGLVARAWRCRSSPTSRCWWCARPPGPARPTHRPDPGRGRLRHPGRAGGRGSVGLPPAAGRARPGRHLVPHQPRRRDRRPLVPVHQAPARPGGDGPAHRVVRPRRRCRALLPGRDGRGCGRGVVPREGARSPPVPRRVLAHRHQPAAGRRVHGRCPHLGGRLRGSRGVRGRADRSSGPTPGAAAVLALALCGGVLVRSEGVLFAGPSCWRSRWSGGAGPVWARRSPRSRCRASPSRPRCGSNGAGWRGSSTQGRRAISWPASVPTARAARRGTYLLDRLQGIWHSTFEGTVAGPLTVRLLLPVALALLVAVRPAGPPDRVAPELVVGGLAALAVLVWVVHPTALVRGFMPAAPVVVLGVAVALVARRWRDGRTAAARDRRALHPRGVRHPVRRRRELPVGRAVPHAADRPARGRAAGGLGRLLALRPAPQRRLLVGSLAALALLVSVCGVAALGTGRQLESSSTRRSPRRRRR